MHTFKPSFKPSLVYIFTIADETHHGCLKIGMTTIDHNPDVPPLPNSPELQKAARKRINSYTQTAGVAYELLHTESTCHNTPDGRTSSFTDKQVHSILLRSGVKRRKFHGAEGASEWFVCDLGTARMAIDKAKLGLSSLDPGDISTEQTPIVPRPEQREAVDKTKKRFRSGNKMLWYCKMRFGKTVCALYVAKELHKKRTIIITHRPVVDNGWFEDFNKVFSDSADTRYGSKSRGERSFAALEKHAAGGGAYVYFASMQDMRGSKEVGGLYDKNAEIFSVPWDLLIVDEAHEGTRTELGEAVIKALAKKGTKVLQLSGTPFNLLGDFRENEVFTWDYTMEQRAKAEWELLPGNIGEPNPYADLPELNIYTYDLGALMGAGQDGTDFTDDSAFNFREFFRTLPEGGFAHPSEVDSFLNLLCQDSPDSLYPYSNPGFRAIFRHTLWVLPGVRAAKELSAKLREHPVFGAFEIVNVAGDGDDDEENRDALSMVNRAMGPDPGQTYTITLTCGRLTTGVSVRPWTAVFMLAGSHTTSAAGYMQTIFRVQTPFTHNGRTKQRCYAFDFAPDRTLRIFAETAKVSAKAGRQTDEDRAVLGQFLNFCPVIAIRGSRMEPYDVPGMLAQLKRAQIERVVRCGFEDGTLYNDSLMRLSDHELQDFADLRGIIGATQAMPRTGEIVVNRQGMAEERREGQDGETKPEPTPDEKARREALRAMAEQRRKAVAILRGISIRMPMMIYGAELAAEDTAITIDNFTEIVDDESWAEFMPRGVDKDTFGKFKRYYDPEIFCEAGKRIRQMARAADSMPVEQRVARIAEIFSYFRNPDKETVLTPWRVVNMHMAATLGGYCFWDPAFSEPLDEPRRIDLQPTAQAFGPDSAVLEINSKSGLYPLYAAYSIWRAKADRERSRYGEDIGKAFAMRLWDETLEQNVFTVCKTPMARSITRRTLAGFRQTTVHAEHFPDLVAALQGNPAAVSGKIRDAKNFWKLNGKDTMKIDAVIGNPPYQITKEKTSDAAVYHTFIDLATAVSDRATLITPARYLFNAGNTPEEWNKKILNDDHFRVALYWADSTEVFPTVDIKGGVAVMYRDRTQHFGHIGHFTAFPELTSMLIKVRENTDGANLSDIIHPQNKFILERLFNQFPQVKGLIGSNGRERRLTTSIFALTDVFRKDQFYSTDLKILGLIDNNRVYRWVDRNLLEPHPNLDKYKVIVPKSNGSGAIGEVLSTPLIGEPLIGVTQSFITIGAFSTRGEAEACLKYVKTKFARTMLGILKATQDNPRETWRLVPLQDFTHASDIDWGRSVEEIDRRLYAKYGLSPEEIAFIEEKVRAMA